jgi:hypothetical protein
MHTHSHFLRELAKIGTGLVLADLISVLWLGSAGFFPLTILGITWSASAILPIAAFDAVVALLLVHIGWNMKLPVSSPSERGLLMFAAVVFLIVGLLHLARLAFGWGLILGSFDVPSWLSWIGFFVTVYLSYSCFHFAHRAK